MTAGAGGAAAAIGVGARITKLAQKLSKPFKDLISKLKRRRARHRTNDGSDRRVETEVKSVGSEGMNGRFNKEC